VQRENTAAEKYLYIGICFYVIQDKKSIPYWYVMAICHYGTKSLEYL
jgi:hypothetical protein